MIQNLIIEYNLKHLRASFFNKSTNKIYENIKLFLETNNIDEQFALSNKYYSFFLGLYYFYEKHNHTNVKKYLKISFKIGNIDAIHNLGLYYDIKSKKKYKMKKYYKIGINYDHYSSIHNLGLYYQNKKKYNKMKYYYDLNYTNNCAPTYLNYSIYYANTEINYKLMKKYLCKFILCKKNKSQTTINIYNNLLKIIYRSIYQRYKFKFL